MGLPKDADRISAVQMVVQPTNAMVRFRANMTTGAEVLQLPKGFGFIARRVAARRVRSHVSAVRRAAAQLVERVSFDVEADQRSGKSAATNLQTV
jgi:CspA family cold shock protein